MIIHYNLSTVNNHRTENTHQQITKPMHVYDFLSEHLYPDIINIILDYISGDKPFWKKQTQIMMNIIPYIKYNPYSFERVVQHYSTKHKQDFGIGKHLLDHSFIIKDICKFLNYRHPYNYQNTETVSALYYHNGYQYSIHEFIQDKSYIYQFLYTYYFNKIKKYLSYYNISYYDVIHNKNSIIIRFPNWPYLYIEELQYLRLTDWNRKLPIYSFDMNINFNIRKKIHRIFNYIWLGTHIIQIQRMRILHELKMYILKKNQQRIILERQQRMFQNHQTFTILRRDYRIVNVSAKSIEVLDIADGFIFSYTIFENIHKCLHICVNLHHVYTDLTIEP